MPLSVTYHGELLQLAAEVGQLLVPVVVELVEDVSEAAGAQARMLIQVLCIIRQLGSM